MDKSEGKNFFSKTFSSVSEKVAKLYHTGNMKLSISSLKRARSEKIQALGNKVFDIIAQGKILDEQQLDAEYKAIAELDKQIAAAMDDLEKIQDSKTESTIPQPEDKPKATKKPAAAKASTPAKKPAPKKAAKPAAKKTTAKKPAAKKSSAAKSKLPAVKSEAKPAVKSEAKPAIKTEHKPAVKPAAEIMKVDSDNND